METCKNTSSSSALPLLSNSSEASGLNKNATKVSEVNSQKFIPEASPSEQEIYIQKIKSLQDRTPLSVREQEYNQFLTSIKDTDCPWWERQSQYDELILNTSGTYAKEESDEVVLLKKGIRPWWVSQETCDAWILNHPNAFANDTKESDKQ